MNTRNYWFTSDTHFGHANILKYCPSRAKLWSSVEEMDQGIVERWNSVVKPGDIVYHLGDVFHGGATQEYKAGVMGQLRGSKRLLLGNHDDYKDIARGGWFKKISLWRIWNDAPLLFTHVPVHPESISERLVVNNGMNIHGHTHENGSPEGRYASVCVEMTNFTPVNLDEIKGWL